MEIFFILLIVFSSMIISATLGFGDALILIPLLSLMIDTRDAIVLSGFWGIIQNILNMIRYRNYIDTGFLKKVIPLGIPGIIIGSFLIGVAPIPILNLFLGIFLLGFIWFRGSGKLQMKFTESTESTESKESSPSPIVLGLGGFSYGFLGGLIGASGPINVVLLQATHHEKESFIGTFAATGMILTIIKLSIYLGTGVFPNNLLVLYLLGIPTIFLASFIGHHLTKRISLPIFQTSINILLGIMAIRMIIIYFSINK